MQQVRDQLLSKLSSFPTSLDHDEGLLVDVESQRTTKIHAATATNLKEGHNLSALQYRVHAKRHLVALGQLYGATTDIAKVHQDQIGEFEQNVLAAVAVASEEADDFETEGANAVAGVTSDDTCEGGLDLREGEMPIDTSSREPHLSLEQQLERFNTWFNEQTPSVNHIRAAFIPGWRIGTVATANISDKQE